MKDAIVLPPAKRTFASPSGNFALTLSSLDGWKTFQATAELVAIDGAVRRSIWRQTLPHEKGPRHVLVLNSGAVILIDEWINVPSRHALMLIDAQGKTLAHYSIDELISVLGVARGIVGANGKLGVWLSEMPTPNAAGTLLNLRSAGRWLRLDLASGRVTAADQPA